MIVSTILFITAAVIIYFKFFKKSPEDYELIAPYYKDRCWTINDEVVDTQIYPFKVDIKDSQLEDLKKRIQLTR